MPRLDVSIGATELVVGSWLLVGWWRRSAVLVAAVLFAAFGAVSLAKAVTGETDCGCFGRFSVNPWLTSAVDAILAVGLMFCTGPAGGPEPESVTGVRRAVRWAAAGAVVAGCGLLVASHEFGPVRAWVAVAASRPGLDYTSRIDAGKFPPDGRRVEVSARFRNDSDRPVRFVGKQTSCSCVTVAEVPAEVPVGEGASVRLAVKYDGRPRPISERVLLFTDNPDTPRVRITVTGEVRPD